MEIDFAKLLEPFEQKDIEWRIGRGGEKNKKLWATCLCYVTNRAVMDRLDKVCGPQNWQDQYREWKGGQLCGISIKVGSEWVTKWDGADDTAIESLKGGLSDSEKRAAVKWGIGRYLYRLDEGFAKISNKGRLSGKVKVGGNNKWFDYDPPKMPSWAYAGEAPPTATLTQMGPGGAELAEEPEPENEGNPLLSEAASLIRGSGANCFFEFLDSAKKTKGIIGEEPYRIILKAHGINKSNEANTKKLHEAIGSDFVVAVQAHLDTEKGGK